MIESRRTPKIIMLFLIASMGMLLIATGINVFVIDINAGTEGFNWIPALSLGVMTLASGYILLKSHCFILIVATLIYLVFLFAEVGVIIFWFDISGINEWLRFFFAFLLFAGDVFFIIQFIKECRCHVSAN